MINLVMALQSEARPFVDHFRLQKQNHTRGFSVYDRDGLRLIVTGIGKRAVREACQYLHALGGSSLQGWLNVGIAGHRDLAVGTGVRAARIIDHESGDVWHPSPIVPIPGITKTVCTLEEPDPDYPLDNVYDMEASAYYAAVARFGAGVLAQCYKIISDNRISGLEAIDPQMVTALLGQHVEPVITAVTALADRINVMREAHPGLDNSAPMG
jgi:hypothetical protein